MKYLLIILLASCTTTKTFVLDGSKSEGNIVKYEWMVNGLTYQDTIKTQITAENKITIELIVTDNIGRKDTAIKIIP